MMVALIVAGKFDHSKPVRCHAAPKLGPQIYSRGPMTVSIAVEEKRRCCGACRVGHLMITRAAPISPGALINFLS
jgi:hypothetical protein